jgi:hypothetical protein
MVQQSFCQRFRNRTGLAISASLVVLTTIAAAEQLKQEIRGEQGDQEPRRNASQSAGQVSALEIELQKAQERARLAEKNAELAEKKVGALEAAVAEKDDRPATAPLESSRRRQDLARVTPAMIHNSRQKSFVRPKFVDVKTRLIELWHRSLARSQRPKSPRILSNFASRGNRGAEGAISR